MDCILLQLRINDLDLHSGTQELNRRLPLWIDVRVGYHDNHLWHKRGRQFGQRIDHWVEWIPIRLQYLHGCLSAIKMKYIFIDSISL